MDPQFPLTDKHCEDLDCLLQSCADTSELCRRLREAGIPADVAEQANNRQAELAKGIKRVFFPNRP